MPLTSPNYKVAPATPHADRHTIHGYFTGSPESPDGSHVLYYTSATNKGHEGDIRIRNRHTGVETIVAVNIVCEDAHRVACQQWAAGGRRVAYQTFQDGRWIIGVYDLVSRKTTIAAQNRQLGWGNGNAAEIPLVGLHWDATTLRDVEYLNVETGAIRVVLRAEAVREHYPEWVEQHFGDRPISLYAAMTSWGSKRLFFKVAAPGTGDWQSTTASKRFGLLGYDAEAEQFLFLKDEWGHPCWMPDNRHILNVRGAIVDSDDGSTQKLPNWPPICASHPSPSVDGLHYVTDSGWHHVDDPHIWEIVVGDLSDGSSEIVYQFNDGGGARSWRLPHAHPTFSADGQRIYFNTSDEAYTQLHVLERIGPWI